MGIIVPIGITTEDGTKEFFSTLVKEGKLLASYGFENEEFLFIGIANVVCFTALLLTKTGDKQQVTKFAFYLRVPSQICDSKRVFTLSAEELNLLNPNTHTSPVFRTTINSALTLKIYQQLPVMLNEVTRESPWKIKFMQGLFNTTTDSSYFMVIPRTGDLPLYEPKLFWFYDHRFSSQLKGLKKGRGGRGLPEMPVENYEDPAYVIKPRYWVSTKDVQVRLPQEWKHQWLIAFRGVSSAKLERTMVFSIIPFSGASDMAQLMFPDDANVRLLSCLIANCNSIAFDYVSRQKVAGSRVNFFYVKQLPVLPPSAYTPTDIDFILSRVLELVYTAYDLKPFAEDMGYNGAPFRWDEDRRAILRAELDAYYARLYGLTRKQLRYILDPADLTPRELEDILDPREEITDPLDPAGYAARTAASDFPGETFRVLKEKELRQHGEYRTRRLVLEAWERLERGDAVSGGVVNGEWATRTPAPAPARPEPQAQQPPSAPLRPAPESKAPRPEPTPAPAVPAAPPAQPTLSDFGLYKCLTCGQMVMGYEKDNHTREKHRGQSVEWKKVR